MLLPPWPEKWGLMGGGGGRLRLHPVSDLCFNDPELVIPPKYLFLPEGEGFSKNLLSALPSHSSRAVFLLVVHLRVLAGISFIHFLLKISKAESVTGRFLLFPLGIGSFPSLEFSITKA